MGLFGKPETNEERANNLLKRKLDTIIINLKTIENELNTSIYHKHLEEYNQSIHELFPFLNKLKNILHSLNQTTSVNNILLFEDEYNIQNMMLKDKNVNQKSISKLNEILENFKKGIKVN